MKKTILLSVVVVVGVLAIAVYLSPSLQTRLLDLYFHHERDAWIGRQKALATAGDIGGWARFTFPDGSWIAMANEHSCCSGAGFDCVVAIDSKGDFRVDPDKNFCGREGLENCLGKVTASSVAEFYTQAEREGLDFK
ncbi:MAG: hypothetical protein GX442_09300 [Candidatus Riflebacteria bacterium]|nr:hypothetical protein [Candidatus Riflebacteria bacterium]